MEKKLIQASKEKNSELSEYFDFVKKSVEDGSYFKDALNWYFFRYVTPICDRTMLLFGSMLSMVVIYCLYIMIGQSFPLVEKKPIVVYAKDQSEYLQKLVELKPKSDEKGYDQNIETVDQAVAKYLLAHYVKERESFDFSSAEIDLVNQKFNRIKNLSSVEENRNFRRFMAKENPLSPINFFGKEVSKKVVIDSILMKVPHEADEDFAVKARNFILAKIPTQAEIRFTTITKTNASEVDREEKRERFLAKISFNFDGVKKDQKGELNFVVTDYKLYRVK